jgi:transcriptional regulator with PAS, ATPase and Fis domain
MLREILDAIPSFVLVVDEDLHVLEYNAAAEKLTGLGREQILLRHSGDLLHCLHALDTSEGCGHGEGCKTCTIRKAVNDAFLGTASVRRKVKMELLDEEKVRDFFALITATPFTYGGQKAVLLVIEDFNEVAELQRIVPICMNCKKVREDNQYWTQIEDYFKRHWDLGFSYSLCPDCAKSRMERLLHKEPPADASQ